MGKIELCGVKIDNLSRMEAVERAMKDGEKACWVVTPNAVMLDACRRNADRARLLNGATLSLADGKGVLLLARRNGTPLCERVAGIDFAEALLASAAERGMRVFLLGGEAGVAERASACLRKKFPTLCICGTWHGYFSLGDSMDAAVLGAVRDSKADILLVCMGFPRQEEWIAAHLSSLEDVRIVIGLGGSLDVWAGNVKRAPHFLSVVGLEWAWRMLLQPKRLRHLPALFRMAFYFPQKTPKKEIKNGKKKEKVEK